MRFKQHVRKKCFGLEGGFQCHLTLSFFFFFVLLLDVFVNFKRDYSVYVNLKITIYVG